ncbi:MAG: type I methionyl aminopeptidase [Deltaproteobacteria bacterium]|jgi:methionyl aminopeptidase|nr:type I methionyl aminopeptidase [Deltaproteobacteria bacterium]
MVRLKNAVQIEGIRRAGRLASRCLDMVAGRVRPGVTTAKLDGLVGRFLTEHGAKSATLGYREVPADVPFPANSCISVNDEVVHGIPGPRTLRDGDLVKVDVTVVLDGFMGDTARTFLVGAVPEAGSSLARAAEKSLELAIGIVRDGVRLGDIGHAVQSHVEPLGFSVVREFGGHGVGLEMHEPPTVPHYGVPGRGLRVRSGMVFTIEPMINQGAREVELLDDGWTVVTADGSLSAQFEHTLVATGSGAEILTLS